MSESVYYVGRVIKLNLTQEDFQKVLFSSEPIEDGDYIWNIIDVELLSHENHNFIFGKLVKAKPEGIVRVLGDGKKSEIQKEEQDLIIAVSPFVYIPEYSGIAFQSIANYIEPPQFRKRFIAIIKNNLGDFFVDLDIKLISDLVGFFDRLKKFERISTLRAKVNPPNPLFGRLWESLKQYLVERKADEVFIKETTKKDNLNTKIIELIKLLLEGDEEKLKNI